MKQGLQSVPVFYSEHMLAEAGSFSQSAGKPRHVLAAWQKAELPITVRSITPASEMDLCLAHDSAYVRGVLESKVSNGFGNTSLEVARSLPYSSGAMIATSRAALELGCACAPVSGFHHAQYDSAAGYCTFSGLVITAQKLLAEGAVQRVLILDCDMHYGDGTEEIVERLGLTESITNATFGRWFHQPSHASAYLRRVVSMVNKKKDRLAETIWAGVWRANLFQMRSFYLAYCDILQTTSGNTATRGAQSGCPRVLRN